MSKLLDKDTFVSLLTQDLTLTHDEHYIEPFLRCILRAQLHGFVAHRLSNETLQQLPHSFNFHMRSVRQFSLAQQTQTEIVCRQLAHQLAKINIRVILLKGAAYIIGNKPNSKGRLISDIDIIVPRDDLAKLESFVQQNGWQAAELEDYDDKYYREWSHELPPYTHLNSGVTLDIHHNLLPESSGKTIDTDELFKHAIEVDDNLAIPDNSFLILHSAIHLLLNDDIEKGLRDCLDLHLLLNETMQIETMQNETMQSQSGELIINLFEKTNCQRELVILLHLLESLFAEKVFSYQKPLLQKLPKITWLEKFKVHCLYHAVFPETPYLNNSSKMLARAYVYVSGHLSKMPFNMFVRHIGYKTYRNIVKKVLGSHVFSKSPR